MISTGPDGSVHELRETILYFPARRKGDSWIQKSVTRSGAVERTDIVRWTPDGVFQVSVDSPVVLESDGERTVRNDPCSFRPPQLRYRLPVRSGERWSGSGVCVHDDGREQRYEVDSEVIGADVVRIAGRQYPCNLIEEEDRGLTGGSLTRCFSPELGLSVRVETSVNGRDIVSTLVRIPPEAGT